MLKTNFDRGRDHLSMFQPFVDDTVRARHLDGATAADVQVAVAERHQLALPLPAVRTLMSRASRRGLVRREGGRYFTAGLDSSGDDLIALRAEIEDRQRRLARQFQTSAKERGLLFDSTEDALRGLITFIERHHVRLALDGLQRRDVGVRTGASDKTDWSADRVAAAFLSEAAVGGGELAETLDELLEGYILQNTLLLADISAAERAFRGLRVFFDSTLIFGILGLQGEGNALLSKDFLRLLAGQGARPEVFRSTIREMQRILAVYETRLGTQAGRKGLYPTELTRHLLSSRATPADVRAISSMLEWRISELGISIVDLPTHVPAFTLGEAELGRRLAARPGGEHEGRVVHDVDCVAAVLTLRRGVMADSLDNAKAIFVTSSSLTVENTVKWFTDEDGTGVPPIIHYFTLSNLAWLKHPGSASDLKMHELVALCGAALRPTRKIWERFLSHLDRLEREGQVTSDEVAAIMASGLTDRLLASDDVGEDPDSDSLSEVVERVRQSMESEANARLTEAEGRIAELENERSRQDSTVVDRAGRIGTTAASTIAVVLVLALLVGSVVGVVGLASGEPPPLWALLLGAIPLAVAALMSLFWGFNIRTWHGRLAARMARRVEAWLGLESAPDAGVGR